MQSRAKHQKEPYKLARARLYGSLASIAFYVVSHVYIRFINREKAVAIIAATNVGIIIRIENSRHKNSSILIGFVKDSTVFNIC